MTEAATLEVLPPLKRSVFSEPVWREPPAQVHPKPFDVKDKKGHRIGLLTVIRFHEHRPEAQDRFNKFVWLARCSCSNYITLTTKQLWKATNKRCCSDCKNNRAPTDAGVDHVARLEKETTLYNILQEWLKSRAGISARSRFTYISLLNDFEIFMGGKLLNMDTWLAYQQHLIDKSYSPWSIHKHVLIPRCAFNWAKQRGWMTGDWWKITMRLPPIIKSKKEIFTHGEYERMKAHCKGRNAHLQYQLIVSCYANGMSPIDVCLIKWPNVDWECQYLHFVRGKMVSRGGRECSIPFNTDSDFHKLLLEQLRTKEEQSDIPTATAFGLDWAKEDYVFPELAFIYQNGRGYLVGKVRPYGHTHLLYLMKTVMNNAGITGKRSLKTFRNTFCSDMMAAGVDPLTICQMTGHSNPKQLLEYCTPDVKVLHDATQKRMDYARQRTLQLPQRVAAQ